MFRENLTLLFLTISPLLILIYLYLKVFPKPLPGIPYNFEATWRVLGDIPARSQWYRDHGEVRKWYQAQFLKLGSPIIQVFISPLSGSPTVLLCDHREIRDILIKRHQDFDRGGREAKAFGQQMKEQFLSIKTPTARFKFHKELMKDLMLPGFLNDVSDLLCGMDWFLKTGDRSMLQISIERQ
jgi:hypothetical protein